MNDSARDWFKSRAQRVDDAVALKVPDRVPVVVSFGLSRARYAGITGEDAFYDAVKWQAALEALA